MSVAWICDAVQGPIGRYVSGLSFIRTDDFSATPLQALLERNDGVGQGIAMSIERA